MSNTDDFGQETHSRPKLNAEQDPHAITMNDTSLTIKSISNAALNADTNIPIFIDTSKASEITAFDLHISFDNNKLKFQSVSSGNLTSTWGPPVYSAYEDQIKISQSSAKPLRNSSGTILNLIFKIRPQAKGASEIRFNPNDSYVNEPGDRSLTLNNGIISLNSEAIIEQENDLDAADSSDLITSQSLPERSLQDPTPEQVVDLKPIDLVELQAGELSGIPIEVFGELDQDQLIELSPNTITGIEPEQFAALPPEAVSGFRPNQFSGLSAEAVSIITPEQFAELPTKVVSQMSLEQFKALPKAAFSGLQANQIKKLPFEFFAEITSRKLRRLTPKAMSGINSKSLAALTTKAIGSLTPLQLIEIPAKAFRQIIPEQFIALPTAAFQELESKQISKIPPACIEKISKKKFKSLSPSTFGGLRPEQFAVIPPEVLKTIEPKQARFIAPTVMKTMELSQFRMLPPTIFGSFKAKQLKQLTSKIVKNITQESFAAITSDGITGFKPKTARKFDQQLFEEITPEQMSGWKPKTLSRLRSDQIASIPPDAFVGVTANQAKQFKKNFIDKLEVAQIQKLELNAINAISPQALIRMDDLLSNNQSNELNTLMSDSMLI